MNLPPPIKKYEKELSQICEDFGVEKMYAFGSVLTDKFNPATSDIDLIVELEKMPPLKRGKTLLALWDKLETLFKRKVDLISNMNIRNPYLKESIESTKKLIYVQESEEILV